MRRFFALFVVVTLLLGGACAWWLNSSLTLKAASVDLHIESGTSARSVAQAVADAGVQANPILLYWWFRLSGESRQIKAGNYEIERGITPRRLLSKLVNGEEALRTLILVEGWNFTQVRAALAKADQLKSDTQGRSADWIMAALEKPGIHPEGQFFPDTYSYSKGSSDLAVLKRAMLAMDKHLEAAWAKRDPNTPLKTREQALILASIVEKETGRASDREMVAGVFSNRLRIGMMLQTDPTVIYGLGESFDGNLRKRDLQTDTPWNTYTRTGLPPTPIAMPGLSSLLAAVKPSPTKALYFVAKGDGTSHFSPSLEEHNQAVNKYQRGQ